MGPKPGLPDRTWSADLGNPFRRRPERGVDLVPSDGLGLAWARVRDQVGPDPELDWSLVRQEPKFDKTTK